MKVSKYWKFLVAKEQLPDWLLMLLLTIVGGIGIYWCYPFPGTLSDSFGYLRAAIDDKFFVFRPFGYSAFLQFVHFFSHSITSVLCSQLLLLLLSSGMLILAMKCYLPIKKVWIRLLLVLLMLLNPAALYMCNSIMSDVLFTAEVYVMLAMMMVIIYEQSWAALALFIAAFVASLFTRYSGVFFVVVFIPLLLMVRSKPMRWVSVLLLCCAVLFHYQKTKSDMYETTHLHQFSTGFDGWQWANNGMHVLPFLTDEDLQPSAMPRDTKVRRLHEFCMQGSDSLILAVTKQGTESTSLLIWHNESPLKQYMFYYMQATGTPYIVAWAKLGGGVYADYGKWLIKTYPLLFWEHYLGPNIKHVFVCKNEGLIGHYEPIEAGKAEICDWFSVPRDQVIDCRYPFYEKYLKPVLPWWELATWMLFIAGLIALGFCFRQFTREQWMVFSLVIASGFILYGTTAFAAFVVLRYWLPMQLLKFVPAWMFFSVRKQ